MERLQISLLISSKFNPLSASVAVIETSQLICRTNQLTGFLYDWFPGQHWNLMG